MSRTTRFVLVFALGCHFGELGRKPALLEHDGAVAGRLSAAAPNAPRREPISAPDAGSAPPASHANVDAAREPPPAVAADDAGSAGPTLTQAQARYVSPRVVYTDQARELRVFGSALQSSEPLRVFVDQAEIGMLRPVRDGEGRIGVPMLPAGEHFLRVGDSGSARAARLFVAERRRDHAPAAALPGDAVQVVYEPERGAFFAILGLPTGSFQLVRIRQEAGEWKIRNVDLPQPLSLTVSPDGRELLVMNSGCALAHVDPDTLALRGIDKLDTSCPAYRTINALADGELLFGTTDSPAFLRSLSPTPLNAPQLFSGVAVLSQHQTRLLWAEAPASSNQHPIYSYEVGSGTFTKFPTLGSDSYSEAVLALSGGGERMLHRGDVYDAALEYLGSLESASPTLGPVALSGDGHVAAAFDPEAQAIRAYDVRGKSGPFKVVGSPQPIDRDSLGGVNRLVLDDGGETAYVFTYSFGSSSNTPFWYFMQLRLLDAPLPAM